MQVLIICSSLQFVQSQDVFDYDYNNINTTQLDDPAVLKELTKMAYQRLSGVTSNLIHSNIAKRATFCVTNP